MAGPRAPWHHGRLGALALLAALVAVVLAFSAASGPDTTCVPTSAAGNICRTR